MSNKEVKNGLSENEKSESLEETHYNSLMTFDDFIKVIITVGQIQECEPMTGSSKLLKLQVDFGDRGKRQVLAGIAKFYTPEELVGRKGVFVTNLPPRPIAGTVSEAMILGAKDEAGVYHILAAHPQAANGSRVS